ncbi:baseplate assembly protein [Pseudorhizobium flavum]|uniref:baseplate assembly protein n=1 Tax=Pseudorhizobium flavum TaxID=1335061 RepID=UPI002490896B|nr:baseplate assembly protein [Pseudorhizobium flavum]
MIREFVALNADVEALKNAFGRVAKVGPVEELDAEKGYRLKLGERPDGGPFLSPWYPHPETGKTSVPLKKGQIVGVLNPSGDPRQGILIRGGYSDEHASPNQDLLANVFEDAGVRVTVAEGALVIEAGGVTMRISSVGVSITGGRVEHDGKNIGSSHIHGGVVPGGADTDVPSN